MFFLLIWGFKTRYKTVSTGVFFCPQCGGDREYVHKVGRRWFRLYYIPLFPVGSTRNEVVQCNTCTKYFTMAALQRPTSAQLSAQLLDAIRGAAVHVLRTGSMNDPIVRAAAVTEVQRAGLAGYDDVALSADLDVIPGDLTDLLSELGRRLAASGKENLVQSAVRVAVADGPATDMEMTVINHLGASLGLTAMHVEGICARAAQPAAGN
jgi:Tellurite resistance protein TerB